MRCSLAMDPKKIDVTETDELQIVWQDEVVSLYTPRQLRLACPCAQCVEEWTGEKILDPASVSEEILLLNVDLVGRYALNFKWSDFHETGIFTFELLRKLGGLDS
ncbi:MAG: DUF971 domain-containing protein [Planctomycetota bacterium]|nr:DUF971 domain-containing protein [Planctomycetota bacterium]